MAAPVEPAAPQGVLTAGFPSPREMIVYAWSYAARWAGSHWLITALGVVVAVGYWLYVAVRQGITGS